MLRCDNAGKINKWEEMPNGSLRIFGTIAKVGWLKYDSEDGASLEYVDQKTLFDNDHLDSIGGAALTLGHPPDPVSPKNYKEYAVGSTGTQVFKNLPKKSIEIITIIGDEEAIKAVKEDGVRELSMGYTCEIERYEGKGNRYKQINRRCNHNALVRRARAKGAKLHLDGYAQGMIMEEGIEANSTPKSSIISYNQGVWSK